MSLRSYKQQQSVSWTRVDMLIALYTGAIERLDDGVQALRENRSEAAAKALARAQLVVSEIAAGVNPDMGQVPQNVLRLCEFVLHCIQEGNLKKLEAARLVLDTLREGLMGIREEANRLERAGEIPAAQQSLVPELTA
jgi:flagellar protein FliS